MGEYNIIANVDKKEYLDPDSFGDSLKVYGFSFSRARTLTGLAILLTDIPCTNREDASIVGRWHGDRIINVGDGTKEYYDYYKHGVNISPQNIAVLDREVKFRYAIMRLYNYKQFNDFLKERPLEYTAKTFANINIPTLGSDYKYPLYSRPLDKVLVANYDRHEYFCPSAFGDSDTFLEMSYADYGTLTVLSFLLTDPANIIGQVILSKKIINWYGNRIGIVSQGSHERFEEILKIYTDVSKRIRKEIDYYGHHISDFLKTPIPGPSL